jgi:hypothetical protein
MQMYAYDLNEAAGEFTATVTSTSTLANPAIIISTWAQLAAAAGTSTILQQHG